MRISTSLLVLWLTVTLSGCAVLPTRHVTAPIGSAGADCSEAPFSMRISIRIGATVDGTHETRLVTGTMWGNGTGPVRMDLSTGIGTTIARCLEDGPGLYVYVPHEKNLYVGTGNRPGGPTLLGFRLPFGLREISLLARGCLTPLTVGPGHSERSPCMTGLPSRWSDRQGWTVDLAYREGTCPYKITATHLDGSEVVVIVKRLGLVAPYAPTQLRLDVPAGTTIK